MFALNKKALSHYVGGECQRRLRLDLYENDAARENAGAPIKDPGRPGLALLARQGRTFERRVFHDLASVFADRVIRGADLPTEEDGERAFAEILLADHIDRCSDHRFLIEAAYPISDTFFRAHGLEDLKAGTTRPKRSGQISSGHVRPDILHVVPADGRAREAITIGGEIEPVTPGDPRLGLRIIDVKLSGEPSPAHFAELAFYGMVLAAWLVETGRSNRFVVLKDAAIWPGKHQASEILRLEARDNQLGIVGRDLTRYLEALGQDLETLPAEVVLGRVRRFLAVDLREVLSAEHWHELPWHVDTGCSGCDFLGYDWKSNAEDGPKIKRAARRERYCWNQAEALGHLSRIIGLTRGACGKLKGRAIESIADLAALDPRDPAFDDHQKLMATRTLVRARSEALSRKIPAEIPPRAGTSSVIPAWSHIKVALTADFDVGSGLTFALGYQLIVNTPKERTGPAKDGDGRFKFEGKRLKARVILVRRQSQEAEQGVVKLFMTHLVRELREAADGIEAAYTRLGAGKKEQGRKADLQIYLWDRLTFDHVCRVTGRHLTSLIAPDLKDKDEKAPTAPMAWLFPAEQLIQDADFTSVNSPITILSDAIQAMLAADVPHHYSLIGIANAYRSGRLDAYRAERGLEGLPFRLHSFFLDPLSDQIPSERGHEVWAETSPFEDEDPQTYEESLKRAVRIRLDAIHAVADRLVDDLKGDLSASAPSVKSILEQTKPLGAVAQDFEILYQHARLIAAAARMKNDLLMALPPHQREATFESARLHERLEGAARAEALATHGLAHEDANPDVLVFRMSPRSTQSKIEKGDFLTTLLPEKSLNLQHRSLASLKAKFPAYERIAPAEDSDFHVTLRDACKVGVEVFDRLSRVVVLRAGGQMRPLVQAGILDFAVGRRSDGEVDYAVLDPLVVDFFVGHRLRPVLKAIRAPALSAERPLFRDKSLTRLNLTKPRLLKEDPPITRFIWDADALATEGSGRSSAPGLARVDPDGTRLTPRQRDAMVASIENRLCLLWGPPGTGKTFTVVAIIRGLLADAAERGTGLRLAITGPTWVSIETVAKKLPPILRELGFDDPPLVRLASGRSDPGAIPPELRDYVLRTDDTESMDMLRERLNDRASVTIVASTAHQLNALASHKVAGNGTRTPMLGLFDFMLVDEASQLPVSQAVVAFATLDERAGITVVGDDLQMPPIQEVEPPDGASHLVGSIYDFYRHYRRGERRPEPEEPPAIARIMLDRSYRSNAEIVDFVRLAGYRSDLGSNDPGLRIRLNKPLPEGRPADWPEDLHWHGHLARILDPEEPLVAVIHPDPYSSQRNDNEADLVAGLVRSMMGRLAEPNLEITYSAAELFTYGVGVVTPHRAQQAAIVDRLSRLLPKPADRAAMMASVDTVERFQGQERDVMIASFGLGDRDQIGAEEEFLYSLNRFNVIASRAKAKLIVIMSRRLVDHLPRDPQVLRASRLLKHFADGYLPRVVPASIPGLGACEIKLR
ncbi:AAA domain-containing protein [Methylobacterium sp. 22177]|uniref:bifunctional RecB family nuclease/DEAD/DEAH box helicase n=1 Tax=Methylobacterium sp. 22177 TaxID=3453885 RepID=UPI003F8247D9